MADVFYHCDAVRLLNKKHIVFFGDSNARAVYKDLICLLSTNSLIDHKDLKRKQENSYCGDRLGKHSELNRGREYEEERSFKRGETRVDFYFITKCYTPVLVDMMEDIHLGLREPPDIIYINSTLWDVTRWGPNGVTEFKDNLTKLARLFKTSLPPSTLVIWATAVPVSPSVQSSLLIKQIDFLRHTLRFDVMEANQFARQVMVTHGFDVLDNHFYMRMQIHRRVHDGIHYQPVAIRLLTNLLLTHIALSWNFRLPNRVTTIFLKKAKEQCGVKARSPTPELKSPQIFPRKPEKQKKPIIKQRVNDIEQTRYGKQTKKFSQRRNGQPYTFRLQCPNRPSQPKSVGRNQWSPGATNTRSWGPGLMPPSNTRNGRPNHWDNQAYWSEDHWPDEQQRFSSEPRFMDNYRPANNVQRIPNRMNQPRYPKY